MSEVLTPEQVTSANRLADAIEKLAAASETQQKVLNKLEAEIPSIIDEKRYFATNHIVVPPQSHNLVSINQIVAVCGAGGGTLILGDRRIPLPAGGSFLTGPFLLTFADARELWNGTPEVPGPVTAMGLELMGVARPTLSW